jgi:hypothetical protein
MSRMLTIGLKSAFERVEDLCLSQTNAGRGTTKGVNNGRKRISNGWSCSHPPSSSQ